jgi:hypothetical protein
MHTWITRSKQVDAQAEAIAHACALLRKLRP